MRPVGGGGYTTGVIFPTHGDGYDVWTFTVPNGISTTAFVDVSSVNHTNASCGVYKMYLKKPDKTSTQKSTGVQPGIATKAMVGKWKLFIKQTELCGDGPQKGITINVRYFG